MIYNCVELEVKIRDFSLCTQGHSLRITNVEELCSEPGPHPRGVATLYDYVTFISADKVASIFLNY